VVTYKANESTKADGRTSITKPAATNCKDKIAATLV